MKKQLPAPISFLLLCKTSVLTATGMISFFFLMKLFHLDAILELRYLNFMFIFIGTRHVLLHHTGTLNTRIGFHVAMMMGFITVFFTAALFSTFVFTYLNLDHSFMSLVRYSQPFGSYLTPASSAFVTFLEGVASGAIVAIPVLRTMRHKARTAIAAESLSQLAN